MIESIAIIIVAIIGLVGYFLNKWLEKREKLFDSRREIYPEFLLDLYRVIPGIDEQSIKRRERLLKTIFFSSDKILEKYGRLNEIAKVIIDKNLEKDTLEYITLSNESRNLFKEIVLEMRRNCYSRTDLTIDDIASLLGIEMLKK